VAERDQYFTCIVPKVLQM